MSRTANANTIKHSARLAVIILGCLTAGAGCNRQDTDALSRIGRRLSTHARTGADELSARLDLPLKGASRDPGLQEKIQQRLRWENTLTDVVVDVHVKDKDVELKGIVRTALQRQRAIELAETVAGVDRVVDSIEVRDAQ